MIALILTIIMTILAMIAIIFFLFGMMAGEGGVIMIAIIIGAMAIGCSWWATTIKSAKLEECCRYTVFEEGIKNVNIQRL